MNAFSNNSNFDLIIIIEMNFANYKYRENHKRNNKNYSRQYFNYQNGYQQNKYERNQESRKNNCNSANEDRYEGENTRYND